MSSEVKRYDPINSDGTCGMCIEDADYGAYVEYADYAALEAENARLRRAAQTNWNEFAEREAPRAQLAAIQGGMGEVAETPEPWRDRLRYEYPSADPEYWSEELIIDAQSWEIAEWRAQHQRITAAMAAEVERWKERCQYNADTAHDVAAERDALRAELAEVKASGWRNHSVNYTRAEKCPQTLETAQAAWDRDQELIEDQRAEINRHKQTINQLRQRTPASPDVEGLVKALEEVRSVIDAREMPSELALAALSNMIDTAISTWRQSNP